MNKCISRLGFVIICFFSFDLWAIEFEKMTIKETDKKIISEKQIRFEINKKGKEVYHLQVNTINDENKWKSETLDKDIKKMFSTRKDMYEIFGFNDIQFSDYKLLTYEKLPLLLIFGSYKKINNMKVQFAEGNLYFKDHFLQVKAIKESSDANSSWKEVDLLEILKQIKAHELEFK